MKQLLSFFAVFMMAVSSVWAGKSSEHNDEAYSTLVSIIGTDKYCAEVNDYDATVTYIIYVKDGVITLVSSYLTANATPLSSLQSDGKIYEFSQPEPIRFIVENGKISHIYVIDEDDNSISLEFTKNNSVEMPKVLEISDIIEAMNGVTFSAVTDDGVEKIFAKDGAIFVGMNGTEDEVSYEASVSDCLNYFLLESIVDDYEFYVSDGRIVYIKTEDYTYTAEGTIATMADVVAAMGNEKYIDSENLYFMVDNGIVSFYYEGGMVYMEVSDEAVVTKVGNDYYCFDSDSDMAFIVKIANGKVMKLCLIENGFSNVLLPEGSQFSAINNLEIATPILGKTIKTIENGHIVMVRNGIKYDLSGRKL